MGVLREYDPVEVSTIVGVRALSGFGEDSMVTIARNEDRFTEKVGTDGEVTRAKNANRMGTLTITLHQSSPLNDYMSGLAAAGSVFPVTVIDNNGTSLHFGEQAWIKTEPEASFNKETGDMEWVISIADLDMFFGGNIVPDSI